jgi:ferrochelatase
MSAPGVLLVNLGSPDSPAVGDVRRYLREFLMDPRVLDVPWPIRFCIVHCAILPRRPRQSAEAYRKIWRAEGSPLIVISRNVQAQLQRRISAPVALAMRYQNPSIPSAIERLAAQGVSETLVIPLFPHYAMSSWESAVERVRQVVVKRAPRMVLKVVEPYYADPYYVAALVASAEEYLRAGYEHLLFSFHGVPERHLQMTDPTGRHCLQVRDCCNLASPAHRTCYRAQCYQTVTAFVKAAGIPETKYSVAFQSRLGKGLWLRPCTDLEIQRLAEQGKQRLLVICPAFVSDCLETLEEIGRRGRETFRRAGGRELTLIPCLNEHPRWLAALAEMVRQHFPESLIGQGVQNG